MTFYCKNQLYNKLPAAVVAKFFSYKIQYNTQGKGICLHFKMENHKENKFKVIKIQTIICQLKDQFLFKCSVKKQN